MRRAREPLESVVARATQWALGQPRAAGVRELRVMHDAWCVSQRPPGTHCNCEPEFSTAAIESPAQLGEIVEHERQRTGANRTRDN